MRVVKAEARVIGSRKDRALCVELQGAPQDGGRRGTPQDFSQQAEGCGVFLRAMVALGRAIAAHHIRLRDPFIGKFKSLILWKGGIFDPRAGGQFCRSERAVMGLRQSAHLLRGHITCHNKDRVIWGVIGFVKGQRIFAAERLHFRAPPDDRNAVRVAWIGQLAEFFVKQRAWIAICALCAFF